LSSPRHHLDREPKDNIDSCISSGECASHFRQILDKFPPQVSTRSTAAAWACHVHNEVNKSLQKDIFDCSKIGDFYDCGCADEDGKEKEGGGRIELKVERTGG
jgi:FAD-linked sulfhydryl oxidase